MTNNNDTQPKVELLPWDTSHLKCKCGHKWDDHNEFSGCRKCDCEA